MGWSAQLHHVLNVLTQSMMCAGAIITQPHWLVSGTRIAGSFRCMRQSVLEERFGGFSGRAAVLGTLMHELVQVCSLFYRRLLQSPLPACLIWALCTAWRLAGTI